MKNMTKIIFILFFICFIFYISHKCGKIHVQGLEIEQWKKIQVKGAGKPVARCYHSMVTYKGQHYIACGFGIKRLSDIWQMDVTNSTQTFTKIYESNDTLQGTYGHSTLVLHDKLYILFGDMYDRNYNAIHSIYSYDLTVSKQEWIKEYEADNNFTPRKDFAVATIKDDIYVFGGLNTVDGGLIMGDQIFGYFSYDFEKKIWTFQVIPLDLDFPNAPKPRYGHSMISINNTLYLFGGYDGDQTVFHTIWKYDLNADTWEKIDTGQSEIPAGRFYHTMHLHLNKEFWILGGQNIDGKYLNDIWQFDIANNKWTKKMDSPIPFRNAGSVLQEGKNMKIYVWGGYTDNKELLSEDIIYEYTYITKEEEEENKKIK